MKAKTRTRPAQKIDPAARLSLLALTLSAIFLTLIIAPDATIAHSLQPPAYAGNFDKPPRPAANNHNPIVPFDELLKRPVKLRPVLSGQHPRVFFTDESLKLLRRRAQTADRALWQAVVKDVRALKMAPPPPDAPMLYRSGVEHPDANSFIIYSHGKYLTGDTGYTGVKQTNHHNTILVDGRGQEKDGRHEVFKEVPYERLNKLRLADVWSTPEFFYARGLAAPAYYSDLNLARFDRHFLYIAPDYFVIWDELVADTPRAYTWLLNAEETVVTQTRNSFALPNGDATLFVQLLLPDAPVVKVERLIVTTQGRPGEVEKGRQEQRGVQLVESTPKPGLRAEFLHFMQPIRSALTSAPPRVSALTGSARGVRIQWPNGETEIVLMRGSDESLSMNGQRAVARVSTGGAWQRLVLQRGTRLSRGNKELLRSTLPVDMAFQMTGAMTSLTSARQKLRGTLYADDTTLISVSAPVRPRRVRVNGADVKSQYDETTEMVSFTVGAGTSTIEWD